MYLRRHKRDPERDFSAFERAIRWPGVLSGTIGDCVLDGRLSGESSESKGTVGESVQLLEDRDELVPEDGVGIV